MQARHQGDACFQNAPGGLAAHRRVERATHAVLVNILRHIGDFDRFECRRNNAVRTANAGRFVVHPIAEYIVRGIAVAPRFREEMTPPRGALRTVAGAG